MQPSFLFLKICFRLRLFGYLMNKIGKYPLGLHLYVFKLGFQTEYEVIIMRVYEVVLIFNVLHKEKLFSFQWPYKAER